mmetsp:Transcript_57269/g.125415  ORF Transcript_57269/g.125415 Transcript_57269/m.125415 type:complete len:475 (-) Transcript_57269:432-1856(-)
MAAIAVSMEHPAGALVASSEGAAKRDDVNLDKMPYVTVQFDDGAASGVLASVDEQDYEVDRYWQFQDVHSKAPGAKILFNDGDVFYIVEWPKTLAGVLLDQDGDGHRYILEDTPPPPPLPRGGRGGRAQPPQRQPQSQPQSQTESEPPQSALGDAPEATATATATTTAIAAATTSIVPSETGETELATQTGSPEAQADWIERSVTRFGRWGQVVVERIASDSEDDYDPSRKKAKATGKKRNGANSEDDWAAKRRKVAAERSSQDALRPPTQPKRGAKAKASSKKAAEASKQPLPLSDLGTTTSPASIEPAMQSKASDGSTQEHGNGQIKGSPEEQPSSQAPAHEAPPASAPPAVVEIKLEMEEPDNLQDQPKATSPAASATVGAADASSSTVNSQQQQQLQQQQLVMEGLVDDQDNNHEDADTVPALLIDGEGATATATAADNANAQADPNDDDPDVEEIDLDERLAVCQVVLD